jgi:bifunctional non-homologous end joining protein LigD
VFIDWSQNDPWKSIVAPWSVRGYAVPTVAVPLGWADVERVAESGEAGRLLVLLHDALRLLDERAATFTAAAATEQRLPDGARSA